MARLLLSRVCRCVVWTILSMGAGLSTADAGEAAQPGSAPDHVVPAATEDGRVFFVSPDGDDANSGTEAEPFRTIQKAADVARPGDTVWIGGGIYRESVEIRRRGDKDRPICFRAASGQLVEISGADPIEGPWTRHETGIFKTRWTRSVRQLFAGGQALGEARWPNANSDQRLDRSRWAKADRGSRYGRIVDPRLAEAGFDATGAIAVLNVAHQFFTWTRAVESHQPGAGTFQYARDLQGITHFADKTKPWEDDRYFLFGKLELLDAPGEWFHDEATGTLYLWPPDGGDPSTLDVQAKSRDYGLFAEQCEGIQLIGLHFFGCTMALRDCDHCGVTGCHFLYPSFARRIAEEGLSEENIVTEIRGNENTVSWCSLAYGPTGGLKVGGYGNTIDNVLLHDFCTYGDLRHPGLALSGVDGSGRHAPNRLRYSTLCRCGNAIINYRGPGHVVEYNHVYYGGLACKDVALVYTGQPSTAGNVVRYNWVHGCYTESVHRGGLRGGLGIRGDDQTRGLTVHHNVVWDCGRDGIIVKGDFNRVVHNTVLHIGSEQNPGNYIDLNTTPEPKKPWRKQHPLLPVQNEHSLIANNAARTITGDSRGTDYPFQANLVTNYQGEDLKLVAAARGDFRPQSDSPLVDAGTPMAGLDARVRAAAESAGTSIRLPNIAGPQARGRDDAPDLGAYEHGEEAWTAGHRNGLHIRKTRNGSGRVCLQMPPGGPLNVTIGGSVSTFTPENWMVPREVALEPGPLKAAVTIPQAGIVSDEVDPQGGRAITFIQLPHTRAP